MKDIPLWFWTLVFWQNTCITFDTVKFCIAYVFIKAMVINYEKFKSRLLFTRNSNLTGILWFCLLILATLNNSNNSNNKYNKLKCSLNVYWVPDQLMICLWQVHVII